MLNISKSTVGAKAMVDTWVLDNQFVVDRFMERVSDLQASDTVDFAMLSVVLNEVHSLRQAETLTMQASVSAA